MLQSWLNNCSVHDVANISATVNKCKILHSSNNIVILNSKHNKINIQCNHNISPISVYFDISLSIPFIF